MQTYIIKAPAHVSIEVINAALAQLGVTVAPKVMRQKQPKPARIDAGFPEVIVRNAETGEVTREIDGITAQKAIAKIMGEVRRRQNADGRNNAHFPDYDALVAGLERRGVDCAHEYITRFCSSLHHVKAEYANGVTA